MRTCFDDVKEALAEMIRKNQEEEVAREIKRFAKRHKYFEDVRVAMGCLMEEGLAINLGDAYRIAVRMKKTR